MAEIDPLKVAEQCKHFRGGFDQQISPAELGTLARAYLAAVAQLAEAKERAERYRGLTVDLTTALEKRNCELKAAEARATAAEAAHANVESLLAGRRQRIEMLEGKLEASEASRAAMRGALRKHVICHWSSGVSLRELPFDECINCNGRWQPDAPEQHKADCPAALSAGAQPGECEECGKFPADSPSKLCPGCAAYREHTGAI